LSILVYYLTAISVYNWFDGVLQGACCWEGRGVQADKVRAVRLFQRAATANCREAQYNLGLALWNGIGTDRNCSAAIYWYQKAAEQGDVLAQVSALTVYQVNYEHVT
jgi:uncharacterized protein